MCVCVCVCMCACTCAAVGTGTGGQVEAVYSATFVPDLMALLPRCDFVVLCAPGNASTRHMIAGPQLAAMKRTAVLVNVGRGACWRFALQHTFPWVGCSPVPATNQPPRPSHPSHPSHPPAHPTPFLSGTLVDHDALVAALRDGTLWAAGLDVTDPEPLPRDHPLLTMDQVVISPHVGTATLTTRARMVRMALDNLAGGLAGGHMPYELTRTAGPGSEAVGGAGATSGPTTGATPVV
jgi:hypothetical protein